LVLPGHFARKGPRPAFRPHRGTRFPPRCRSAHVRAAPGNPASSPASNLPRQCLAARLRLPSLLLLGTLACTSTRTQQAPHQASDTGRAKSPLPFISDDPARALSEAREKVKAYVLSDPKLAKHAGRFVWLEVDTDLPRNEAFLEKYPLTSVPTLYVNLQLQVAQLEKQLAELKDSGRAHSPNE
jgi:hypothetical protein